MAKGAVVGLIPAAGLGRRAGQPKAGLILSDDPRPLLVRCVEGLRLAGASQVITIVRSEHRALAESAHATAIVPSVPTQSMIESIHAGLLAIEQTNKDFAALLLCPVDSARAAQIAYGWLGLARTAHPESSIVPKFGDRTGHPAFLPRRYWQRLRSDACRLHGARAAFTDAHQWPVEHPEALDNINDWP